MQFTGSVFGSTGKKPATRRGTSRSGIKAILTGDSITVRTEITVTRQGHELAVVYLDNWETGETKRVCAMQTLIDTTYVNHAGSEKWEEL